MFLHSLIHIKSFMYFMDLRVYSPLKINIKCLKCSTKILYLNTNCIVSDYKEEDFEYKIRIILLISIIVIQKY